MARMIYKGVIADHPTPKISVGEVAFSLRGRDFKGGLVVVLGCDKDDIKSLGYSEQTHTYD